MAFILVQHLDPTHDSMLVELLAGGTSMTVVQAADQMAVEPDHLYVIPPGSYLALKAGKLHLSAPLARHGARLPFDFFLKSLAESAGAHAVCVILSGSGADGALGCQAVKAVGGLVIAQDPAETAYDGMPRSAIGTGAVDKVLKVAEIGEALVREVGRRDGPEPSAGLARVIEVLRQRTAHDFTLYKSGTLERRVARRMALAGLAQDQWDRYVAILETDAEERSLLTGDLLINVTRFFRDPKIFEILASTVVPELVSAAADQPIRIWVAGCSTGEETYSIVMLFQEHIAAIGSHVRLQVFASDVDAQAVTAAREGLYPAAIAADVSPERLARFFVKEDRGLRISPDLRGSVVFAVQDVLADPPFSKLDFISCRNLLIYLRPDAQAKIISIFNFALRRQAFLLLGSAEAVAAADARFAVVSKPARLYRKIAHSAPSDARALLSEGESLRGRTGIAYGRALPRGIDMAELCRKLLLEHFAPAALLINAKLECLYSTGPTTPYLRVAPGYPSYNVLTMMQPALRARAKAAIAQAIASGGRITVHGGRLTRDGVSRSFDIDIRPAGEPADKLMLVCFVDVQPTTKRPTAGTAADSLSLAMLEKELEETRSDLQDAIDSLETASQEQNAINEEALSVNEEYQSTNEELLTSKEELQSLNEELIALNSQLQETLERSRMTSDDLQNILYSTDVATLFLDAGFNIRFFTPAIRALFALQPVDIGRPLADFSTLTVDPGLLDEAAVVLRDHAPIEREIQSRAGIWFNRRILPYRTHDGAVAGLVITFTDVTERKRIAADLKAAQLESEQANLAKSRFLAAASHDLRQPLQTLTLLSGLLSRTNPGEATRKLLATLDDTAGAMAAMLNTLLDINQLDSGLLVPALGTFPVNDILLKLGEEFSLQAQARGLALHVVPCGLHVKTDPALLEQMIRNLLGNALKYTRTGRVLLGCRRRGDRLLLQVADTGLGIPEAELANIFEEFHQLNNPARERSQGLGLGLSIVQRLSQLLDAPVRVRSILGKGSSFTIELPRAPAPTAAPAAPAPPPPAANSGSILIIEDEETIRDLLAIYLSEEGFATSAVSDGAAALRLVSSSGFDPDVIIADYNLPGGQNGLETVNRLRALLRRATPAIVLSGDISSRTLREIAAHDCAQLSKPMKLDALLGLIHTMIAAAPPRAPAPPSLIGEPVIFIVDDDPKVTETMSAALVSRTHKVRAFASCEAFLAAYAPGQTGCLVLDAALPGMSGLELLRHLRDSGATLPAIVITGQGDVAMAVAAMKAGAIDFMEKPVSFTALRLAIEQAMAQGGDDLAAAAQRADATARMATLTPRQREILDRVLAGQANKNIAADLGISQRTVETHRAAIMTRTGAKSIPALARMAVAAAAE
jgi:two-component system CheB/CheR fusion protein